MIDPTDEELQAIMMASKPAGEYIDSLKTTDMAEWSEEEWFTFLEVVVTGFRDGLISLNYPNGMD